MVNVTRLIKKKAMIPKKKMFASVSVGILLMHIGASGVYATESRDVMQDTVQSEAEQLDDTQTEPTLEEGASELEEAEPTTAETFDSGNTTEAASTANENNSSGLVTQTPPPQEATPGSNTPIIGTWGTSPTSFDSATGTLTVSAGELAVTPSPGGISRDQIYKIIFEDGVSLPENSAELFGAMPNLTEIVGSEKLDTSNVTDMRAMFFEASGLSSLDVSGWDTSNVLAANMQDMLAGTTNLSELKLGPDVRLRESRLPSITAGDNRTGAWQRVAPASPESIYWSSNELVDTYDGSYPGTYVWQRATITGEDTNHGADPAAVWEKGDNLKEATNLITGQPIPITDPNLIAEGVPTASIFPDLTTSGSYGVIYKYGYVEAPATVIVNESLRLSVPTANDFGEYKLGDPNKILPWNTKNKVEVSASAGKNWELTVGMNKTDNLFYYVKVGDTPIDDTPIPVYSGTGDITVSDNLLSDEFLRVDYEGITTPDAYTGTLNWQLTPTIKEVKE
ncbi:BspA family leucine-rich repeat surface protein (plasmid) [Lactococcus garvieae]|uniref:BspA family leucine-rich repeat surface protein n=1 Tax=Lactococcus garvieae TaxID=1363 RepID=UPI0030CF0EDC